MYDAFFHNQNATSGDDSISRHLQFNNAVDVVLETSLKPRSPHPALEKSVKPVVRRTL